MQTVNFSWKNADYKIISELPEINIQEIKKQRLEVEKYISVHPEFKTALKPLKIKKNSPEIVKKMHSASLLTGVGPMASVAGIIAQYSAESSLKSNGAIVENGGDIYITVRKEVIIGLYAGANQITSKLAFRITPDLTPLAVCSSSSNMGHSLSFGNCDLATVISKDGALADAAATLACNLVKSEKQLQSVLNIIKKIDGISGCLLVKNNSIGMIGNLPELVRNYDKNTIKKVTKHSSIILP